MRPDDQAEVRYHMLRPGQIVARRKACPVAYIPLGPIEWHGVHNATGVDALRAEGLSELCARRGGGLVFPPMYYGESRVEGMVDSNADSREAVAREMELPVENLTPEAFVFSAREQIEHYHKLLLHVLAQVQSLGFKLAVLVVGHGPVIDWTRAAVLHHNKRRIILPTEWRPQPMLAWACADWLIVPRDRYPVPGDHGGGWETSQMMHLHPETVDLKALPPKGEPIVGVGGIGSGGQPQDATAGFGEQTFDVASEAILKEVQHRLANPQIYFAHGMSLAEGLWKSK